MTPAQIGALLDRIEAAEQRAASLERQVRVLSAALRDRASEQAND